MGNDPFTLTHIGANGVSEPLEALVEVSCGGALKFSHV
jgi:hypothetical protein